MLFGALSDIFGRRWFVLGGNTFGLIGAIIAATAQNISTLIGASVFIGIAAAVQLSYTMIIGELVPIKDRGYWYAVTLVPVIPFAFFGAFLSHNFLLIATWRWSYYLCIILQGIALILLAVSYFPPSFEKLHSVKSRKGLIKEIDYIGIFLWTLGVVLFLLGISWGGGQYPWKSAAVISTLVIGGVGILAFFVWEAKGNVTSPLLSLAILRAKSSRLSTSIDQRYHRWHVLLWIDNHLAQPFYPYAIWITLIRMEFPYGLKLIHMHLLNPSIWNTAGAILFRTNYCHVASFLSFVPSVVRLRDHFPSSMHPFSSDLAASTSGELSVLPSTEISSVFSDRVYGNPRKRKTTSNVWAHTREPYNSEPERCHRKNERIYYCRHCNDPPYSSAVSTTFRHHLFKVHGIELEAQEHPIKRQRDLLIQDAFTKASSIAASKRSAVEEEVLRATINEKAVLEALVRLVTVRNLPYNCSAWPELHAFIASFNPAAKDVISLSHGSIQKLVSRSYYTHKDVLRKKLQSSPSKLHLSADVWSAPNHQAFLGICVKFVDPDAKGLTQAMLALSTLPGSRWTG